MVVALVKKLLFVFSVALQVLEIAVDGAHLADHGEGAGMGADDGGKGGLLGAIDHTDQHIGFLTQIHTLGRDQRGTVVKLMDDGVGNDIGFVGDDLKTQGTAAIFHQPVGYGRGCEAVEDAKDHRLHLIIIDKVGDQRHTDIEGQDQIDQALLRVLLVDQRGDKVGAAGVSTGPDQQRVARAIDDAGHQRAQDDTAVGSIGKAAQIHLIQHQKRQRKGGNIHHGADGQRFADLEKHQDRQGDIDQQAHIADADAGHILDHGAKTVQTGRGEAVGKDEQLIVQRTDQRQNNDHKISKNLFHTMPQHQKRYIKEEPARCRFPFTHYSILCAPGQ
mgnify:CR=1 FL=1